MMTWTDDSDQEAADEAFFAAWARELVHAEMSRGDIDRMWERIRAALRQGVVDVFVPWNPANTGRRSANVGWITDANGCDIWQGGRNQFGYPVVWNDGRLRVVTRVRYERDIGPIPSGAELDHYVCNNGPGGCCNPFHCRPVTTRENTLRSNGVSSRNAAKTHCPNGHLLSGDNLLSAELARGGRECRVCHNARQHAYRAKRKGKVKLEDLNTVEQLIADIFGHRARMVDEDSFNQPEQQK